jgi:hypothetical protein
VIATEFPLAEKGEDPYFIGLQKGVQSASKGYDVLQELWVMSFQTYCVIHNICLNFPLRLVLGNDSADKIT